MKLKSFCTVKEAVNRAKRWPTEWERTLAKHTSNRGLVSRIYNELKKLNKKT